VTLSAKLLECGDEIPQAGNRVVGGLGRGSGVAVCAVAAELLVDGLRWPGSDGPFLCYVRSWVPLSGLFGERRSLSLDRRV
jgi:hypothetical protein